MSRRATITLMTAVLLTAAACAGDAGTTTTTQAEAPTTAPPGTTAPPDTETTTTSPVELRDVTLALSTISPFSYGYQNAKALGFYEEEGLNVELQATGGSSDIAQILATGTAEAGMASPGAPLSAIEAGAKLYPFYTYAFGSVFDIRVPVDSDIQTVEDLEGLSVGISELAGGEVPLARFLLINAGLDPDTDVNLLAVGTDAPLVQLAFDRGDIQAYVGGRTDLAAIEATGVELRSIFPEGLQELPSDGLLASQEASDDRDLLIGLGRATAKGQLVGYTNFDATVCILKEQIPESFTDEETGRASLEGALPQTTAPQDAEGNYLFGEVDVEDWNANVQIFLAGGTIETEIDMGPLVIDDLFEEINDFDQAAVIELANNLPTDC